MGGSGGPYVLGLDFGTESCRAAVFDVAGRAVGIAAVPYPTGYPQPGWAEQDPQHWWEAACTAVRRALAESGLSGSEIAGLACDATSLTLVATDAAGTPLRPAILWMDVRAVEQAARADASRSTARRYNGGGTMPASAEWYPFKAAWLKEHEPDVYSRAAHLVDAADWITFRLTGEWTVNLNSAALRMYYDGDNGGWPEDLYDDVGVGDVLGKLTGPVLAPGAPVGELTDDAAAALGLPAGVPVAQGVIDAWAGQIGLGVLAPGRMALITGSSHVFTGQSAEPISGPGFFGAYTDGVVPGEYTVEGGQASTGSVLKWFVEHFAPDVRSASARNGTSPYDVLNERARHLPPGAEGVVVNEYFQGNRTPYTDGDARGMIWGLSLHHGPEHVYRAIQEGVCYGTEHIRRVMADAGHEVHAIVAGGGATRSRDWMQMHADVTGVPITLTHVPDATALGTCVLAAAGAGLFGSVRDAAAAMVRTADVLEPDPDRHEEYGFFVDRYVEAYPLLREPIHAVAARVADQASSA
ncbi:carbohydrate kinase FGGY [Beutenbergia cavernae DSM 12333]|uniref:Carbohydrate kinase FGGY n=1 Tax=Beutenbergia cavernae (strain ATCC BAA-8 / DSM 12333 / CCUG 43141 / JCM 11478 / NBRC 16432 / NCIMB 13614 / HKI 0122) TaxID=471853 RepID=C5C367_BEUC1|nr:FGGY-family carbohydrate kinase [Beutenbergia cavernae]ACQ79766.1 carbohydrate kinase FGGY [Beutenbergia cavernae DSM 12333]